MRLGGCGRLCTSAATKMTSHEGSENAVNSIVASSLHTSASHTFTNTVIQGKAHLGDHYEIHIHGGK